MQDHPSAYSRAGAGEATFWGKAVHRICLSALCSCFLAGTQAHAGDVPDVKAGLWTTTTTSADANVPAQKVSMCMSTALLQMLFDQRLKSPNHPCKQISVAHSGSTTTEETECKFGDTLVKSKAVTIVSGNTAVRTEVHPEGKSSVTSDSTYVGECPAGMQLGDFVSADGVKSNILHPDAGKTPASAQ